MNTVKTESIIRRGLLAVAVAGALAVGTLAGSVILNQTTDDTTVVAGHWW